MKQKKTRLEVASHLYFDTLQDLLCNPKNEDSPDEIIEPQIEKAEQAFIKELLQEEQETIEYILSQDLISMHILKIVFAHFNSVATFNAIKIHLERSLGAKFEPEESFEKYKCEIEEFISEMQDKLQIN